MAFLNSANPDVCGPEPTVEEEPYLYGFVWTVTRRTNNLLRVTWAIDASGGESPASTYNHGGVTYDLVAGSVDRAYSKALGTYTALYRKEGTWTPVVP
jgi:hypothetical protein